MQGRRWEVGGEGDRQSELCLLSILILPSAMLCLCVSGKEIECIDAVTSGAAGAKWGERRGGIAEKTVRHV